VIEVIATIVGVLLIGARLRPQPMRIVEAVEPAHRRLEPRPPGRRPRSWVRRRRPIEPGDLATWCDGLARAVRGGATLHHALQSVEPPAVVAEPLEPMRLALARGRRLSDALPLITAASPHLDLVLVVLGACATHGGPVAEPIDRAATALRQRAAIALERRTHSAHARASAMVMTALPGALLAVLLLTSAPTRTALATPVGVSMIAAGLAANLTGWLWMRRLIAGRP
jgi:tight adherence protein B